MKKIIEEKGKEANYSSTIDDLKDSISSLKGEERALSAEILNLKNIKDICPTCGQKLPGVVKPDTTEKENKLEEIKQSISKIESDLAIKNGKKQEDLTFITNEYNSGRTELDAKKTDVTNILLSNKNSLKDLNNKLREKTELKNIYQLKINSCESNKRTCFSRSKPTHLRRLIFLSALF